MKFCSIILVYSVLLQAAALFALNEIASSGAVLHKRHIPFSFRTLPSRVILRRNTRIIPVHRQAVRIIPAAPMNVRAIDPFQSNHDRAIFSPDGLRRPPLVLPLPQNSIVPKPSEQAGLHTSVLGSNTQQIPLGIDNTSLQTSQRNSLLQLLEERTPVIGDERDLSLIRQHLTSLNSLRQEELLNKDKLLERQISYIQNITDTHIQREVLKIFVKDIVEKSGFMSQKVTDVQDIDALRALIDKIGTITDTFTNNASGTAPDTANNSNLQLTTTTTPVHASIDLRSRIMNSLTNYDRNAHTASTSIQQKVVQSNDILQTYQGRNNTQPRSGLSIFGDSGLVAYETTTARTETAEVKRVASLTEPLGGNDAYWTHLRAGLADMLCNLCRQRQNTACIKRYCQNDMVRTETQTPSAPVAMASVA